MWLVSAAKLKCISLFVVTQPVVMQVLSCWGIVFVDQAYWQSAIAARPSATWKGYILGGLMQVCPVLCLCPALPCPALPCPALPCPALPCPALPCPDAVPCPDALPCPVLMLCRALMPCSALPCPALPVQAQAGSSDMTSNW